MLQEVVIVGPVSESLVKRGDLRAFSRTILLVNIDCAVIASKKIVTTEEIRFFPVILISNANID